MISDELSTDGLAKRIEGIVGEVQFAFQRETGEYYDPQLIEDSLVECVGMELARIEDNMLEMYTSPGRSGYQELEYLMERNREMYVGPAEVEHEVGIAMEYGDDSVFEGFRPFSQTKFAAMMEYLTTRTGHVYKTSLNKLLFYSDLTMFYLTNHGISGATYQNRPFGPVADNAEPLLNALLAEERVKIDPRMKSLVAGDAKAIDSLTADEKKVLDWVANTYGRMSAAEISGYSHAEMAYKYTEANEKIAYAYGKFFKQLPPKDLLDQ